MAKMEKWRKIKYDIRNFIDTTIKEGLPSFSDLIKQKKIDHDKTTTKFTLGGECIIPIEVGFTGMLLKNLGELESTFDVKKVIVDSASRIGGEQISFESSEGKRVLRLRSILASFGYGLPFISVGKDRIVVDLLSPPHSRFGFRWHVLEIQGFLSSICDSELRLTEQKGGHSKLKLVFSR